MVKNIIPIVHNKKCFVHTDAFAAIILKVSEKYVIIPIALLLLSLSILHYFSKAPKEGAAKRNCFAAPSFALCVCAFFNSQQLRKLVLDVNIIEFA